jgi:hypothetical protein
MKGGGEREREDEREAWGIEFRVRIRVGEFFSVFSYL